MAYITRGSLNVKSEFAGIKGNDLKVYETSKISVFIPVYEGSSLLESLLEKLTSDGGVAKEIFVCIDKPNEESLKIVERFRGKACFLLSSERRGKVEALNSAVKLSSGNIFVFLDADVEIGDCADFWQTVRATMKEADIVDFKKKIIRDSFISRMVNYEYTGSNFASYLFSKLVGKCFGVGGTAFAIRREAFEEVGGFSKVVSEDLDLAVKAFLRNKSYKYEDRVEVHTKAPSNLRSWLSQRKRWGIGTGLWIKEHWRKLVAYIAKYPHVALPCAVMIFPTLIPLLLGYVCSALLKVQFHNLVPAVLAAQLNFSLPPVVSESLLSIFFTCLMNFFLGFLAFAVVFFIVSRKLGFHFNVAEFLAYYFVYQPISALVLFIGILRAFASQNHKLDWKV
ncbi:MAG: glycosyltransferase family 2 protein [Candidatus Bathyarchaeia archaeon]